MLMTFVTTAGGVWPVAIGEVKASGPVRWAPCTGVGCGHAPLQLGISTMGTDKSGHSIAAVLEQEPEWCRIAGCCSGSARALAICYVGQSAA
jgi:hypothetical protein